MPCAARFRTERSVKTYRSAFAPGGRAKLVNGVYSVPVGPGSATRLTIQLAPISMVGDLNGDAAQDAAVVLVTNPGGSGTFFDLVAVINQNGKPAPLAPRLLGDRVLIHSIGIDHRQIQVALDARSKHAPMTRRDTRSDRTLEVRSNRLVLHTLAASGVAVVGGGALAASHDPLPADAAVPYAAGGPDESEETLSGINPPRALHALLSGNKRLVAGRMLHPRQGVQRRAQVAPRQQPLGRF